MDRITRLRIKNVRAIEYADVEISRPLTVLIGENGAGKSTVIECLELLRKAADPRFMEQVYAIHRGMPGLLRKGAPALELGVVIEDEAGRRPRLEYSFDLFPRGSGAVVQSERLLVGPVSKAERPWVALRRTPTGGEMFDAKAGKLVPLPLGMVTGEQLIIGSFGNLAPHEAVARLLAVLRGIEVHLGFDTLAAWAARSLQRTSSLRGATTHFPAERLALLGGNLANAWSELRGRATAHWEHTMGLVRLGLGERVDSVVVTPDMGGGNIYLGLRFRDLSEPVVATDLSDGQLAWLAFVAMTRLNEGRSMLVVDELELHLHPSLLGRVVALLADLEGGAPVLVSTHADRVLELLDDPAGAVRVCSLEQGRAVVSRIDASELPRWLAQFGDLGQLRASGYLPRVVLPADDEASTSSESDE